MKILNKTILVLMAVTAISLTSCKKDDGGGGGGSAGAGTIVAKVDGNNFTSLEIASYASISSGNGATTVIIQGSDASGKAIMIGINGGFDGPGTYEISDTNVFVNSTYIEIDVNNPQNAQSWSAPYEGSGVVGEIKVSEKTDTNIKGTFHYTAKNVNGDQSLKNITDGSFDLNFK